MAEEQKQEKKQEQGARLDIAGTYPVAILDEPRWYQMPEKDGDKARMILRLRGYVNGGEQDGKYIDAEMMFIRTIIGGGRDKGKTMFEAQAQKCIELGMTEPFSPSKIGELVGATPEFVCAWEEYEDKQGNTHRNLRVQFINTNSRPPLTAQDAEAIWKELQDGAGLGGDPGLDAGPGAAADLGIDSNDDLNYDAPPF
jgi:hypothetical protein